MNAVMIRVEADGLSISVRVIDNMITLKNIDEISAQYGFKSFEIYTEALKNVILN